MIKRWRKLSEETVVENPWWAYKRDRFELPNGKERAYNYVQSNGCSMVVPITDGDQLLMVRQYRYLMDRESLEFPCGGVQEGSTFEDTARRELQEEAGFEAKTLRFLGEFTPQSGLVKSTCQVYLASDLISAKLTPDETEEFEIATVSLAELEQNIATGVVWDGMTLAAWSLASVALRRR